MFFAKVESSLPLMEIVQFFWCFKKGINFKTSSVSPEFEINHIIIVDPSITPKTGDYVLFETSNSIILRKIDLTKNIVLKAYNSGFSDMEIKDTSSILGVVTQRSGTRRKFHKKYG